MYGVYVGLWYICMYLCIHGRMYYVAMCSWILDQERECFSRLFIAGHLSKKMSLVEKKKIYMYRPFKPTNLFNFFFFSYMVFLFGNFDCVNIARLFWILVVTQYEFVFLFYVNFCLFFFNTFFREKKIISKRHWPRKFNVSRYRFHMKSGGHFKLCLFHWSFIQITKFIYFFPIQEIYLCILKTLKKLSRILQIMVKDEQIKNKNK